MPSELSHHLVTFESAYFYGSYRSEVEMREKRESKTSGLLVHWPVIVFGSALVALLSTLVYQASHSATASRGAGIGVVPAHYDRAADAMPFPARLEPGSFKQTEVREAYQTEKEIP